MKHGQNLKTRDAAVFARIRFMHYLKIHVIFRVGIHFAEAYGSTGETLVC
jgi:hypothetical protein